MRARQALIAPLLLAAACSSGTKALAARFNAPAALASFLGYTPKRPGELHRYLAVASTRGNELRIIDPEDAITVASPGLVFPLSVPVFAPTRLASASPGDGLPDLLVAAGEGSSAVSVVATWKMEIAVDRSLEVDLGPAADIASLAAMPAPASRGAGVWVVVGLADRTLKVIEYLRDPTTGGFQIPIPTAADPTPRQAIQDIGVMPLDIAVEPGGPRLFIATGDPLVDRNGAPVQGVAQVDTSPGLGGTWPVVGLDARGPTRLAVAGRFAERTLASSRAYQPAPQLDVLAVLDESFCGPTRAIDCGLVTLLPDVGAGGIPPDPAGELAYRAPIQLIRPTATAGYPLQAHPLALALVMPRMPPGDPPGDEPITTLFDPLPDRNAIPVLTVFRSAGAQQTSALVVAIAADGDVYMVDPSRWGVVNDHDPTRENQVTWVSRVTVEPATVPVGTPPLPTFGLWNDVSVQYGGGAVAPAITAAGTMYTEMVQTPGYADFDAWQLEWNGLLPGLAQRYATLQVDGARHTIAIQARDASGKWTAGARIWDGSLGVHRGDLVVVSCPDAADSTLGFSARVVDFELPDDVKQPPPAASAYPGGALVLDGNGNGVCGDGVGPRVVLMEVRAQGLLLKGARFGYAGRPPLSTDPLRVDQVFEIRWQDEAPLLAAAQGDPNVDPDAVRAAQEALTLARKARRKFYPHDALCGPDTDPFSRCDPGLHFPPGYDPLTPGPMLRFRVGVICPDAAVDCVPGLDQSRLDAHALGTELGLSWNGSGGFTPVFRRSVVAIAVPTAVTSIDRSQYASTRTAGTEVYASFLDDEVLEFSPGSSTVNSIR